MYKHIIYLYNMDAVKFETREMWRSLTDKLYFQCTRGFAVMRYTNLLLT